jgi:hypothetical protein
MNFKKLITPITVAAVGLGTATISTSRAEETTSEYVAPSEAVPTGKAPRMQIQLLNPGEATKHFPDYWSLHRSIALQVRISPRLAR